MGAVKEFTADEKFEDSGPRIRQEAGGAGPSRAGGAVASTWVPAA